MDKLGLGIKSFLVLIKRLMWSLLGISLLLLVLIILLNMFSKNINNSFTLKIFLSALPTAQTLCLQKFMLSKVDHILINCDQSVITSLESVGVVANETSYTTKSGLKFGNDFCGKPSDLQHTCSDVLNLEAI